MKPLHQMWLIFHWQGPPRRVLAKGEKDTGVTLTRSRSQPRARARVMVSNNDQSFSRPLSAGSAVSMATNPLNVAVDGAEGNSGVHMDLTQAAREGRPNGKAGIGIRATLAEVGLLIHGEDLQHQAPRQRPQSQCSHLQQRRLCLTQLLLLATLPKRPLDQLLQQNLHSKCRGCRS